MTPTDLQNLGGVDVLGTAGADVLNGAETQDRLFGHDGDDVLRGAAANDQLSGGSGLDTLYGDDGDDTLDGGLGNDTLYGGNQNDILNGGAGDDVLEGQGGYDQLSGGSGNDILRGGGSGDTYYFNVGDGADTIEDYSNYTDHNYYGGNQDKLVFGPTITTDELWFSQNGNDLVINIVGTDDSTTIQDWYLSAYNQVEQIALDDGSMLYNTQVQQLVDAMAAFAPPVGVGAIVPQDVQDQLAPMLAANWQ